MDLTSQERYALRFYHYQQQLTRIIPTYAARISILITRKTLKKKKTKIDPARYRTEQKDGRNVYCSIQPTRRPTLILILTNLFFAYKMRAHFQSVIHLIVGTIGTTMISKRRPYSGTLINEVWGGKSLYWLPMLVLSKSSGIQLQASHHENGCCFFFHSLT